jgi:hypothetical protein
MMVDKLLFSNVKEIAETLVKEAKSGQHWAVRAALTGMLPTRSRRVSVPVEREPPTTVQGAVERIADIVARMERGELDLDEAQALIDGARAYVDARKTSELEIEVETLRATVARLTALVEARGLKP